jgi:crossover junction endodeoxyribonuclease RuvC
MPLEQRLLAIGKGIAEVLDRYQPTEVALERVFAQHNVRTVMGTAQASGVALHLAADRGLSVGLHTPSEVKAAVSGYGAADKKQVATMVQRILRLSQPPKPADASDALALALCHAWRGAIASAAAPAAASGAASDSDAVIAAVGDDAAAARAPASRSGASGSRLTPAQEAWRAAEKAARS